MAPLKIAVLGASGIGKFHVREFARAGGEIVAILGRSQESAEETAKKLFSEYSLLPKAYADLDQLLVKESIDAVSVCTPPELHYEQVKKSLAAGLHVLCEKPFVYNSYSENLNQAKELVEFSLKQNKVLAVNTQWPAVLPYLEKKVNLKTLKSFSMHTEPLSKGLGMLIEQLSHQISFLVKLIPEGRAEKFKFVKNSDENIKVCFRYLNHTQECEVEFQFTHKAEGPRSVSFVFNGVEFKRVTGKNYEQKLVTRDDKFEIEDPLKVSIRKFMGAISGVDSALVSSAEILENVSLQDSIIREYQKA